MNLLLMYASTEATYSANSAETTDVIQQIQQLKK